jgi:hypothetical protein
MSRQCSGESLRKPRAPPEPGVGEDDVDAPERVERGADERLLLVPLRDVAGHRERPTIAAELLRERVELVLRARGEHHPVALLRRLPGGGGADPGGGAGDQEDLAVVVGHRVLS